MNRASVLVLLVLVLGGAGAWFVLGDEESAFDVAATTDWLEAEPELEKPLQLEDKPGTAKAEKVPAEETPQGLAELLREEMAGEQGGSRLLVVQVWNGKRGVPAIETDVWFLDGFDGPELRDPYSQHWSSLAEGRGERFRTDGNGRVELPRVQDWAIVTAQREGRYGFVKVGRKHRQVETITLFPDETVTVQVVDGDDKPVAGVPVGIVQHVPTRPNVQWDQLLARFKELNKRVQAVQQRVAQDPGLRQRAAPRIQQLRAQQEQVKRQLGQMKRSRGKGAGKGKAKGKKLLQQKRLAQRKAKEWEQRNKKKLPVTMRPQRRAQRKTDALGLATFRHFQLYRQRREEWWDVSHDSQFEAVLLMPLQQPQAVAFAGHPVSTQTLRLRLPPTGSVTLRTIDLDGRPFTHPVTADVRMKTATPVPWSRMRERKQQNETVIVFPFVGLGLELFGSCTLDDKDFRWNLPPFFGPRNAGEDVTIDVVVAPAEGMFFGRLLDGAGKPLAGLRPSFLISTRAGRLEGEDVTTDEDGRFHLPYQVRNHHTGPYRLEIRRKDVKPVAGLAVGLTDLPKAKVTDLGDLRLDSFGLIAAGTVRDDRGVPIAGATVQLQRERNVGKDQPRRVYLDEAFVTARADGEGKYELFGELEPGRYRLRGLSKRHFPYDSPDLGPDRAVDLQLVRLSKVVGTVLLPEFVRGHRVRVLLQSVVDPKNRREDRIHDHRGQHYIYFDRVRPGLYNLSIRMQEFPDPVFRLDNLELEPGQSDVHPQLANIDLSSRLYQFLVTAVDENGRRVRPDWPLIAKIVRPDGRAAHVGFPWKGKGGVLQILSASPQLEVWPRANGFRAERPSSLLAPGRNEIRMLRIPPVEVQLAGMRALIGKGAMVWVKLQQTRPQPGSPRGLVRWDGPSGRIAGWYDKLRRREAGTLLGPNDLARIPMLADGRYKVMVFLLSTNGRRKARRAEPMDFGEVAIRIVPGSGPQRVKVPIRPGLVQQALARLAQSEASTGK